MCYELCASNSLSIYRLLCWPVATQVLHTVLENRQLENDIRMRLDARQNPFMGRVVLHDSVRRWWLASPLQTNVRLERQKAKDFKRAGGANCPYSLFLRTCEIPKKKAAHCAIAEGKGRGVLRRG